ncbi:MAG: hypothetical protein HYX52_01205 [Chloroflexi bacterium]|nr:hypothetical protein [Chloroflexota bacterium]
MENEELAALRASLLAAERQPAQEKLRQARLSALVSDGDELVPYVLAQSCSDPRDRQVREDPRYMRVLERMAPSSPAVPLPELPREPVRPASLERRQPWIPLLLAILVLGWFLGRLVLTLSHVQ